MKNNNVVFEILFSLVLIRFVLLAFFLVLLVPKQENSSENVKEKETLRIELVWEVDRNIDLDLWVKGGSNEPIGWNKKNSKNGDLVRDDLGNSPGLRYEIIFFRTLEAGEYIINIHYYGNRETGNVPISAEVQVFSNSAQKVSKKIFSKSLKLDKVGEETTVVRFKVDKNKVIDTNFTFRPFNMVYKSGVYQ
jgi:hypothetical protein